MQKEILDKLAIQILERRFQKNQKIFVSCKNGKLEFGLGTVNNSEKVKEEVA